MKASMQLKFLTALAAMLMSLSCLAIDLDGVSVEGGSGSKVRMLRLGVQSNWERRWFESNGTHIGGHWDASVAQWRGSASRDFPGRNQHITSIGLTPVFRLQANDRKGWYGEAGIGVNLLSSLYKNNGDTLSTSFQFSDHLGVGYVFEHGWDVGIKFEHYSNGGIKKPNSGVNFTLIRVARQF